ncbi:hypothetical protein [Devosia enhydra]|uniref:hypothetical protein n=1 Tax=Devosia enhydra TaxID=665118 RepID=UPI001160A2E2|nr:hypothetical protein [Devosia enhydra]
MTAFVMVLIPYVGSVVIAPCGRAGQCVDDTTDLIRQRIIVVGYQPASRLRAFASFFVLLSAFHRFTFVIEVGRAEIRLEGNVDLFSL